MNIIFFGQDHSIREIVQKSTRDIHVVDEEEALIELITEGPQLLFLDYDKNPELSEKINAKYCQLPHVKVVLISAKWEGQDFRKHQKSQKPADGYVKRPLNLDIVEQIIDDFSGNHDGQRKENETRTNVVTLSEAGVLDKDKDEDKDKDKDKEGAKALTDSNMSEIKFSASSRFVDDDSSESPQNVEGHSDQKTLVLNIEASKKSIDIPQDDSVTKMVEPRHPSSSQSPEGGQKPAQPELEQIQGAVLEGEGEEKEAALAPVPAYDEGEMVEFQSTLRQLREERTELREEIKELKRDKELLERDNLSLQAAFDESKIEITILKKRHLEQNDDLHSKWHVAEDKRMILQEKVKNYQRDFERINQKVRIDIGQVRQREKELEGQLELVAMDTDAQLSSRDNKILELKRKIDLLEFNMENANIREQKAISDKKFLERKLEKVLRALREAIELAKDELEESELDDLNGSEGSVIRKVEGM